MIQAKKHPIQRLSLANLGVPPDLTVPSQEVTSIQFGAERQPGELIEDAAQGPVRIAQFLREAKVV